MKFLSSDGVIIKKIDYGEADRLITIFSRRYGKIQLNIKGIRKSKRRDKNAVEILALSKFVFYRKGERLITTNFELVESFWGIRSNIKNIEIMMYILSVLNNILVENQRKSVLYNYFLKVINYLDKSESEIKNYLLVCHFLSKMIQEEGIAFELSEGEYFDIENSKFRKNSGSYFFKLSKIEKTILENISCKRSDGVLKEIRDITAIKKVINILEKYINYHLHTSLNFKHFLGEDLKNGEYS
ncbi:DNA repair protein RecO [uncultured Ilyobacter sp.]|jgi:DNA repair protein RecO (recombination protein O)|uniref:DNA repair protein RecO n=1 Tax=uncultured Ilyobacter sp. TaxID=544433 RepID=UPI0029C03B1B|nr:DNA repair protein RecO [uncultured Ilyobacter sp.]